jgi:hypothetical protein
MFLTVDVSEVDVLVVDVLELNVLGARQEKQCRLFLELLKVFFIVDCQKMCQPCFCIEELHLGRTD